MDPFFFGDTVAVGVAVEAADAADVYIRRIRARRHAVADAADGIEKPALVDDVRPDHRDELHRVRVGILVEPCRDIARRKPAAER